MPDKDGEIRAACDKLQLLMDDLTASVAGLRAALGAPDPPPGADEERLAS